jgi:hypothetical protein
LAGEVGPEAGGAAWVGAGLAEAGGALAARGMAAVGRGAAVTGAWGKAGWGMAVGVMADGGKEGAAGAELGVEQGAAGWVAGWVAGMAVGCRRERGVAVSGSAVLRSAAWAERVEQLRRSTSLSGCRRHNRLLHRHRYHRARR